MFKSQYTIDKKKKYHWKLIIYLIAVFFAISTSYACGAEILFVVGKKDLRPGDLSIKNHLEDRGFNLVVREDTNVKSEDATGRDLVLLSESARSRKVGTKFRDVAVPVICSEPWTFSSLGMTGQTKKVDFGRKSRQKDFFIVNPNHPLCASCKGKVQVCSKSFFMGWGVPGGNAIAVAGLSRDPDKCTIFVYDAGVEMPGLVAPAKRVGFFMFRNTANFFTAEGWCLFDCAVDWSISGSKTDLKSELPIKNAKEYNRTIFVFLGILLAIKQ
jgi:hypothetical protein